MQAKAERSMVSMTQGPILGNMLRFFFPIMLGTLLQQLYSAVDALVLGRFVGKAALAAVGGSDTSLINLAVGFFVGLSSGAAVVISQFYGANELGQVKKALHTALLLAAVVGALFTVLGTVFAPWLLKSLDTPADILDAAIRYLQWYFAGMIPAMIYNMGSGILRAMGDSQKPLLFLVVCAVVNTALDLLFVVVFQMGVAGAAIATSLSQLICAVLVLYSLSRQDESIRFSLRSVGFDRDILTRMLMLGLPAGAQSLLYCVPNLKVQQAINLLGTDTAAAWSIFYRLDAIYWPINGAIGVTVMTFVGQNFGAKQKDRIFRCIRTALWMDLIFGAVYGILLYTTRDLTPRLFSSDPAVIQLAKQLVSWAACAYVPFAWTEVYSSAMRGVGNSLRPTLLTLLGVCILRVVLLYTLTFPHLSNFNIFIIYPITWVAPSVLFIISYRIGKWMPKL